MELMAVLEDFEELERMVGDLYRHFSELFSADSDVSRLFSRLSEDEESHRQVVRYQQRLVRLSPKTFSDIEVDTEAIQDLKDRAAKLLRSRSVSVDSALGFALDAECRAAECHLKNALSQANPAIANLLRGLGAGDEQHVQLLRDFVEKRK
jgi:rubrerythrin